MECSAQAVAATRADASSRWLATYTEMPRDFYPSHRGSEREGTFQPRRHHHALHSASATARGAAAGGRRGLAPPPDPQSPVASERRPSGADAGIESAPPNGDVKGQETSGNETQLTASTFVAIVTRAMTANMDADGAASMPVHCRLA